MQDLLAYRRKTLTNNCSVAGEYENTTDRMYNGNNAPGGGGGKIHHEAEESFMNWGHVSMSILSLFNSLGGKPEGDPVKAGTSIYRQAREKAESIDTHTRELREATERWKRQAQSFGEP